MNLGLRNERIIDPSFFHSGGSVFSSLLLSRVRPRPLVDSALALVEPLHNVPFVPRSSPPLYVSLTPLLSPYFLDGISTLTATASATVSHYARGPPSLHHRDHPFHTTSNLSSDVHGLAWGRAPGQAKQGQLTGFVRASARLDVQAGHGTTFPVSSYAWNSGFTFCTLGNRRPFCDLGHWWRVECCSRCSGRVRKPWHIARVC